MNRRLPAHSFQTLCLLAALLIASPISVHAESTETNDHAFFQRVAGEWAGPGEIVEGKMKGTRFNCELAGLPLDGDTTGFSLDGTCRAGLFSHPVTAVFIRDGESYRGEFLDGDDGGGLDVTGGSIEGRKAVISLRRNETEGALVTNLVSDEDLNITLLIKGSTRFVPVIGLSLKRQTDTLAVGAID